MMGFMFLLWAAVLGGLAWVAVRFVPQLTAVSRRPEDVLRDRYARGEIDRDTFERMREDLRQ